MLIEALLGEREVLTFWKPDALTRENAKRLLPRLRVLKLRFFHRTSSCGAEFWGCGGGEEALEFGDAAGGF